MSVFHPRLGTQKLRIMRTEEGQVSGCLQCSVMLEPGVAQGLVFEESLVNVPVGEVLNPREGLFLADEVQRLMRLGIAAWLEVELCAQRVVECQPEADGQHWTVIFELPTSDGRCCRVGVPVQEARDGAQAVAAALEQVRRWRMQLDDRAVIDDWQSVFQTLDLRAAPHLRCGLARVARPSSA